MDWLQPFRAREALFRANAFALLSRPEALRVALAWRVTPVDWHRPESPCPMNEAAIWLWLWEETDADARTLAEATGLTPQDVEFYIRQLVRNRLIYPDGTVATVIDELANRQVADLTAPKGLQ